MSRKRQKTLVEKIDDALIGWRKLSPAEMEIQWQYEKAMEFIAISQCIKLGVLDERGNMSERTINLVADYHRRIKEKNELISNSERTRS